MRTHYIAWFSAAGTTRQVADMIDEMLRQYGIEAHKLELSPAGGTDISRLGAKVKSDACVWLGSPVYVDHAVPQMLDFIQALPQGDPCGSAVAVPFVTWGAVCSGVALPEMAQALERRGWKSIAAAKVVAQHSSMWSSSAPLAQEHPDAGDSAYIKTLVARVLEKLDACTPEALAPEVLDYLPTARSHEAWGKSLTQAKVMLGEHQPEHELCDGCGTCVELCPVGALSWGEGYPVVGEGCIRCHQCTRYCPQQAFPFDAPMMEERLQQMAGASPEVAETQIYL
ncbi:MAG: 4Fe-4S binding protein [Desulfuromonadaceae bacterium]